MAKHYKVTYKTFFNERLKQVSFHGERTHPLYIQVTFDRKTMFFKSYYFELFSKPRYILLSQGKRHGPTINKVVELENELIDFIIDKTLDTFSLELFKTNYSYYSKDLCDITEEGFRDYLFTFLSDKGLPGLATTVHEGSKNQILFYLVQDLKIALNKSLFDELISNSFHYAPPYLPLFGFMLQFKRWPILFFTAKEWEEDGVREEFTRFSQKNYSFQDNNEACKQIDRLLSHLRNEDS